MSNYHIVNSVAEYIDLISNLTNSNGLSFWYRGHESANFSLLPSVLRDITPHRDWKGEKITSGLPPRSSGYTLKGISFEAMLDDFKRRAIGFLDHEPKNDFEWMFIMQHYGVPTRLLDWSTNALVAMYFALLKQDLPESTDETDEEAFKDFFEYGVSDLGGAIYLISPSALNKETIDCNYPIDVNANFDEFQHYIRPGESEKAFLPISILAPHVDHRIRSQSGVFTLHGWNVWDLEHYQPLRKNIHKILIPYRNYRSMKDELRNLGMHHSFIFPGLDGIAKDITEHERNRFNQLDA